MAKKKMPRAAGKKGGAASVEDVSRGKKPKGVAAVGFIKAQGTRSFRKQRSA